MKRNLLVAFGLAAVVLPLLTACPPPPPVGVVYVRSRPPAIQTEFLGTAPGPDYVWIRGYHRWEGNAYVWTPGRWERPPHARAKWVEGRWRHDRNGWYWVEGRWK